ncbi:3-oxoacyl-ACP reductase FabG [Sporosarcina limicola]|uniref:3-oxoacyl-[acyl-carrier protein] reductase n=1 Tax=Sporosarcina limicola TaxID=34101 RepID=A0A927MPB8_9BACL|nr:3-oxoacyl-ACP reductase FabG [Sporosarcina limicola]MBE1555099.1 3-oxoacyl-[acyl-carrier protein] reductase [Sporosarcina limicola]
MSKIALVTGGSRGIGEAIVKDLASKGWTVYFTYKSNVERAKEIEQYANNIFSYQVDVSDYDAAKLIVNKIISNSGKIDCLINNAGITMDKTIGFMNKKSWNSVIETNLYGTFNYCKFVSKEMISRKKGTIINISSVSGLVGIPGQTNYSASKAGILGFTKALSKELGRYGIRVNAICPGFISTEMTENIESEELIKQISLGRIGETKDITGVINFLLDDASSYITGQEIIIDGGLSI